MIVWAGMGAALAALIVVAFLWLGGPRYTVLYSNLGEHEGGEVIVALEKMNVPYRFDNESGALLVPATVMRRTRMLLAAQGLPKNGNVGYGLLEKSQFGESRFVEHVTYERALEGELARTVESIDVISSATVHVAVPAPSLFVRDQKPPTASVLVHLRPGRALSHGQVAAIAWLISSSVPELTPDHIAIVDQYGNLLSKGGASDDLRADDNHLAYERQLEQQVAARIESILSPMLGTGNVRVQVSADVDFSKMENTSETYAPNDRPQNTAIRSEQTHETDRLGATPAEGVPGALSNEPPQRARAVIRNQPAARAQNVASGTPGAGGQNTATSAQPRDNTKSSTINYELDHAITHVQKPVGALKRLSVAVVVNDQPNAKGTPTPLGAARIDDVTKLTKQAMGYSEARGDTVSVVNAPFHAEPAVLWWRDPYWIDLARSAGLDLLGLLVLWIAWRRGLRPFAAAWNRAHRVAGAAPPVVGAVVPEPRDAPPDRYNEQINSVREIAGRDPRAVAMVMRAWMERKHGRR